MKTIEKNVSKIAPAPAHHSCKGVRVRQFDLQGNYIATYDSMLEASRVIGVSGPRIWDVIHGLSKTCGGFQWRKADE